MRFSFLARLWISFVQTFAPSCSACGELLRWTTYDCAECSRGFLTDCYGVMDRDCGTVSQTWGTFMPVIQHIHIETLFTQFHGCRDGAVERALTSHQYGLGSNPGVDAICGLSLLLVLISTPTWLPQVKIWSGKFQGILFGVRENWNCKTDSLPSKVGRNISGQMGAKDFCNRRLEAATIFEILHLFGRKT